MFKPIQVPKQKKLVQYFNSYGLNILLKPSKKRDRFVNEMKVSDAYKPELRDLYLLHQYTLKYRRTTVLEFGTGWSSLVFANALEINKNKYSDKIKKLRRNNPFELHCLDNEKKYLNIAKKRLSKKQLKKTNFHYSEAEMTSFNGKICTQFKKLPLINPDLIYLDGPDQFNIKGNVSGLNLKHKDMMPMSCDILKFEHFLTPGTIIITDGRAANARFLKTNLQRDWKYLYDKLNDQHLFYLKESALGKYNSKQLDFYFKNI
tara:strand:- start:758 stop:1540 length:783 start_codon:yes stop_codon:yes gene_type:complete